MTRCLQKIVHKRRAAWMCLVGALSASTGCQVSLLSRKKEDPSLHQLMVHPQPWDAELKNAQPGTSSPSDYRGADNHVSDDRYGDTYGGRPNPYSSTALLKNQRDAAQSQEAARWDQLPDLDADDSQWAPHLQDIPRSMWPLAKRQLHATELLRGGNGSRGNAKNVRNIADRTEQEEDDSDWRDAEPRASKSNPAVYRLHDDDQEADDQGADDRSEPISQSRAARSPSGRQSAHYQLRDEEDEQSAEQANQQRRQRANASNSPELYADTGLEEQPLPPVKTTRQASELKPPSSRKSSRQIAHAEPIDTGAGDDVRSLPSRESNNASTKASTVASHQRSRRDTSATTNADDDMASPSVVPASGSRPIQQRPVDAPRNEELAASSGTLKSSKMSSQDHLHEALRCMDEEWSQSLTPSEQLHHQAVKRLVLLASGQLEGAMEPMDALQSHEQEFFRHSLQAWHHAIDPTGNPVLARRWPLVLNSQREALSQLAAISGLEVKNAGFCSNVDGYGSITKFPTTQFRAGQELLLYCEIDNFVCEQVKDGFETKLQGSYEIVDASNVKVADQLLPQDTEVCKRARRDYFLVYRIYIPSKIQPGRYQLRLTIEDMKGKKFGQSTMDFQVGS